MEKRLYTQASWVGFVAFVLLGIAAFYSAFCMAAEAPGVTRTSGKASFYTTAECSTRANPKALMANGHPLDDNKCTAAMWDIPFGTKVVVRRGDKSVTCEITDRGPAKRLVRAGRIIDLSRASFLRLGNLREGLIPVTVEVQQ